MSTIAGVRLLLGTAFALSVASGTIAGSWQTPSFARQLDEANRTFTYDGKPINPRAVRDLCVWISDSRPGPVGVDLSSQHGNRYCGEFTRDAEGRTLIDLKTAEVNPRPDERYGWFAYKRLGALNGGVHVLQTWDTGGGSGVFTHLLLVRFVVDFEYDDRGGRRDRLVMQRMGEISLGDRYSGSVTVQDTSVSIGADPRTGAPARVIRFE